MKTIIIASSNQGKIKEFKEILEPKGYIVKCLKDLQGYVEPEETGTTFAENAIIKASAVTEQFGYDAISDDSGLSIDALNGEPGVHSARWLGHDTDYAIKNQKVLELLKETDQRGCHYTCAIALTSKNHMPVVFCDTCYGEIARMAKGNHGFGYDPIVYYPPLKKTMGEMLPEEKNAISHRAKAIAKLEMWLHENHE